MKWHNIVRFVTGAQLLFHITCEGRATQKKVHIRPFYHDALVRGNVAQSNERRCERTVLGGVDELANGISAKVGRPKLREAYLSVRLTTRARGTTGEGSESQGTEEETGNICFGPSLPTMSR